MIKSRRLKNNLIRLLILLTIVTFVYQYLILFDSKIVDELSNELIRSKYDTTEFNSENYNDLFSKVNIKEFERLNMNLKCDLFFKNLYLEDENWMVDPLYNFEYNKDYFKSFEEFLQQQTKDLKPEEYDVGVLHSNYNQTWERILLQETRMHNYATNLRLFNKCFVEQKMPSKLDKVDISARTMPFLTNQYPKIEDYNGNALKILDNGNDIWVNEFRSNLNGKGIVLTIGDKHLDYTLRLVKVLRFLKNELPIQIVYFKNLSKESKDMIVSLARSTNYLEIGLDSSEEYPKQDIYFVDVSESVTEKHLHKFEGFGNKVLATLFNTFEEMILMDADTVLLVPPIQLFDMNKYKQNGTIFFKDRKAVEFRPKNDLVFFTKMMPSKLDAHLFDIPQLTNYTLQNDFFQGFNHYMESGLVVIDRRKHFFHAFVMAELNCIFPINTRVYGDKELFWLSFLILGDEKYSFNKHFSAAIGEVTPLSERYLDIGKAKTLKSQELCSNHPAHISDEDDHTLLWFNSGFRFCGQKFKPDEFNSKKRYSKFKTLKEFETFFTDKLVISHAIIPPSGKISVEHTDGESNRAWLNMRQYCNGYTWCAYSSIGDEPEQDPDLQGHLIEYNDEERMWFETLGELWMGQRIISVDVKKNKNGKLELKDHKFSEVTKENDFFDT